MNENEIPEWMKDDKSRGGADLGNPVTKRLMNRKPSPPRVSKTVFVQKKYIKAFNLMVLDQKEIRGPIGPELMEEALSYIVKKYADKTIK